MSFSTVSFRTVLQITHYVIWFPLAILVISAILRAGIRRSPLIFAYMVALFLLAVPQIPAALTFSRTEIHGERYQSLHAITQGITYTLLLAVVVSLLYRATENLPTRHVLRTVVGFGVPIFAAASFAIHYSANLTDLMTPWMRDLNFCAAILDLFLWALLLAGSHKNPHVLLLTGGLGIAFAGDAITNAVRSISLHFRYRPLWISADVLAMIADAAWLWVWWQAFRKEAAERKAEVSA